MIKLELERWPVVQVTPPRVVSDGELSSFLENFDEAFVALSCGGAETLLLIPFREMRPWMEAMARTDDNNVKWDVKIGPIEDGLPLRLRGEEEHPSLTPYLLIEEQS